MSFTCPMDTSAKQNLDDSKVGATVIQEGKFFAAVGYVAVLCFVPLFLKRDNEFAQFHGRQGLVLFILEVAAAMLVVVPVVGEVVFRLACFVFGIFSLVGIIRVLMNQYWPMPVVHQIASKITL